MWVIVASMILYVGIHAVMERLIHSKGGVKGLNTEPDWSHLTVLIPFRNEADRLKPLISSLNAWQASGAMPKVVWVDDFSEDNSVEIIKQWAEFECTLVQLNPCGTKAIICRLSTDFEVLTKHKDPTSGCQTPNDPPCESNEPTCGTKATIHYFSTDFTQPTKHPFCGKKATIHRGMSYVNTEWVLSVDADTQFSAQYWSGLQGLDFGDTDLFILPVRTEGRAFWGRFWAWESHMRQCYFNVFSHYFHPLTACGANLLYKKKVYEESLNYRKDLSQPSGDDHFLLQYALQSGKRVKDFSTEPNLAVTTKAPNTLKDGFAQRRRWWGKVQPKTDWKAQTFGALVAFVQLTLYVGIIALLIRRLWWLALLVYLLKTDAEGWLSGRKFREEMKTREVLLFQLIFPFYLLSMAVGSLWRPTKIRWKGRQILEQRP